MPWARVEFRNPRQLRHAPAEGGTYIHLGAVRRDDDGVLHVVELAIVTAHNEVQIACERHKTCGRSLNIDRWTRSERTVAVEISERGGAVPADVDAVEGVYASGPFHKHRRRRRPGLLDVLERARVDIAYYEIQVACERKKCAVTVYRSTDAV